MAFEPLGIEAVAKGISKFRSDLSSMEGAINLVGKSADQLGGLVLSAGDQVVKGFTAITATVLGSATAIGAGLLKLANDTAPLADTYAVFGDLVAKNKQDGEEVLATWRDLGQGLLSDKDIIESYNRAFLSLGGTFAKKLPDQLELLRRASAATGKDLGKVVQSYIKGIGNLSESTLQELGISLDLSRIYQDLAKRLDVKTSELTESQKQTEVARIVNAKLASTYKDVADEVDTNVIKIKRLRVEAENLKNSFGLQLQPAFGDLLDIIDRAAQFAIPLLSEVFEKKVVPAVELVIGQIGLFYERLSEGFNIFEVFGQALADTLGFNEETRRRMWDFIQTVGEVWFELKRIVTENKDVILAAVNAVVTALTFAGVASLIVRGIGLLTSPLALLALAVGGVSLAWNTNFLGIRDFIENEIVPRLTTAWDDLQEPLDLVRQWIADEFAPGFLTAIEWLATNVPIALGNVSEWLVNDFWPEFKEVWEDIKSIFEPVVAFIMNSVVPVFANLFGGEGEGNPFQPFIDGLAGIKEGLPPELQGLLTAIGEFFVQLKESAPGIFEGVKGVVDYLVITLGPTFEVVARGMTSLLAGITMFLTESIKAWEFFTPVWEGIFKFALAVVQNFLVALFTIVDVISKLLMGDFQGALDSAKDGLVTFFNNAFAIVGTNLEEMGEVWRTNLELLAVIVSTVWTNVTTAIREGVTTWISNVVTHVTTLGEAILGAIKAFVERIITWLLEPINNPLLTWIQNSINSLLDWLSTGAPDPLGDWIGDAVNNVKDFLGIESPSKVFEDIGRQIQVGLAQGMGQLGMVPAGASSNSVSTTNNFNLTVNSSAPTEPILQDFEMMKALSRRR